MASETDIQAQLPHRAPFLWVDKIICRDSERIVCEKWLDPKLDIFQGHFPDYPLMPGVLLCEALFQTGALLIAGQAEKSESPVLPMVTRIKSAKFKREVRPGDTISMEVELIEREGPAWYLKGKVIVAGQTMATTKFACTTKTLSS